MKKIIITGIILLFIPFFAYAGLNIYGTYYNSLTIMEKQEEWLYSDLNLFYLKMHKPSTDNYKLESNLSFSLLAQPVMDKREEFDIQRLNFQTKIFDVHLTLGRFLPQYHYTNLFQPLNVFLGPRFFKEAAVYEGIDGILLRKFLSSFTSVEYVCEPQTQLNLSTHLINLSSHIGSFDYTILGLYNNANRIFTPGLGFKGDIGISLFNETLAEIKKGENKILFTSCTGFDYSFGHFMSMVEYLYNGGNRYQSLRDGLSLKDKHYLYVNAFHFKMMERNIGVSGIANLNDYSSILSVYYESEIYNGVNFLTGVYVPLSQTSEDEFSPDNIGTYILNIYIKAKF
jgi:hypothetical protein